MPAEVIANPQSQPRAGSRAPRGFEGDGWRPAGRPGRSRWLRRNWLWLKVQADALAIDPAGYLQAVLWRARGLRVRSRNRIAALAGRSPSAYAYWISAKEPALSDEAVPGLLRVIPVIDCRNGKAGLAATLASLPTSSTPILIGTEAAAGAAMVDRPSDLAKELPAGENWLCPMACGDLLPAGALAAYSRAAAGADGARLVYADDDLVDEAGDRRDPHFKPQWNPDLFEFHDFLTGASIVCPCAKDLAELPDDRWAEALVRKALESGAAPLHLPHVLHHRRRRPEPNVPATGVPTPTSATPLISVVIPTRNRAELLRKCIEGVTAADYPQIEIVVVDNESDERETLDYLEELRSGGTLVIRAEGAFNYSALNNLAVARTSGQLLCFLNNDVEMIDGDWLAQLARHAVRPDIGAVGARLLYPDRTVQHAGVFTGIGGGAGHAHRYQREDERGYFERARLPQRVSAVTAACMVVAKEKFLSVGGFDEEVFPVAFNDVDLCLTLNSRGWQSFYEPRATLIHHESKSRGNDRERVNRTRFAGELAALKQRWATDTERDPYHHPNLSPFCEQFVIAI